MDLKQLKSAGGVVSAERVRKTVVWERDGEDPLTFDIFVKRLSFGAVERALSKAGGDPDRSYTAELIAASVGLGENGDERLSYEDAYQLDPMLAKAFAEAVKEVNELGKGNR